MTLSPRAAAIDCDRERGELDNLLQDARAGKGLFGDYFFRGEEALPSHLSQLKINDNLIRCTECGRTIAQHPRVAAARPPKSDLTSRTSASSADAASSQGTGGGSVKGVVPQRRRARDEDDNPTAELDTPKTLFEQIEHMRGQEPLLKLLTDLNVQFLASASEHRTLEAALKREDAKFPFVYDGGHGLKDALQSAAANSTVARHVALNVGVRGSGKTVLLLRALDAIPEAAPDTCPMTDIARIYVTFNFKTDAYAPVRGQGAFTAGLLLRIFHAVLATLGAVEDFGDFIKHVDWAQFNKPGPLLLKLAEALGVFTLVIAVDEIAYGVKRHAAATGDAAAMETQVEEELCALFRWADIGHPPADAAATQREAPADAAATRTAAPADAAVDAVVDAAATQTAGAVIARVPKGPPVIPILSCYHPRYVRAAHTASGRPLAMLEVDFAPCLNDIVKHVKVAPADAIKPLDVKHLYAACGGHFLLCACIYGILSRSPRPTLSDIWTRLTSEANALAKQLPRDDDMCVVMVAQAVSGMTFQQLLERHGEKALPMDPFFQSEDAPSNLPLVVVLSRAVRRRVSRAAVSPLSSALTRWVNAANTAIQQTYVEGMRKVFEIVTMHGLALRWAAFLAPISTTAPVGAAAPVATDRVGFCAGQGAYLDGRGQLKFLNLSGIGVLAPCAYTEHETFPPPPADGGIALNTYTLASSSTNHCVEGGGCVAANFAALPALFSGHDRVYFTVQMKHTETHASAMFTSYSDALPTLASKMPRDAPCVHLFWTPHKYTPQRETLKGVLDKVRERRSKCLPKGSRVAPALDIIACVNVEDCLTPSLAWTLTCMGFTSPDQGR